jgi:hypothetical protein
VSVAALSSPQARSAPWGRWQSAEGGLAEGESPTPGTGELIGPDADPRLAFIARIR